MGKIIGTSPSSIKGSVGLYTYRFTKDGYIVSEKVKAKGVGQKTLRQCMVSLRLSNLAHLYNSFNGALKGAFMNKPSNQTDQAAFMKANYPSAPVYLTKQASNFGACVATSVQISQGNLPTINVVEGSIPVPLSYSAISLSMPIPLSPSSLRQFWLMLASRTVTSSLSSPSSRVAAPSASFRTCP